MVDCYVSKESTLPFRRRVHLAAVASADCEGSETGLVAMSSAVLRPGLTKRRQKDTKGVLQADNSDELSFAWPGHMSPVSPSGTQGNAEQQETSTPEQTA